MCRTHCICKNKKNTVYNTNVTSPRQSKHHYFFFLIERRDWTRFNFFFFLEKKVTYLFTLPLTVYLLNKQNISTCDSHTMWFYWDFKRNGGKTKFFQPMAWKRGVLLYLMWNGCFVWAVKYHNSKLVRGQKKLLIRKLVHSIRSSHSICGARVQRPVIGEQC